MSNHAILLDAILSNVDVEDAPGTSDVVYRIKTGGGDFVVNATPTFSENSVDYAIHDWTFEPATGPVEVVAVPWSAGGVR